MKSSENIGNLTGWFSWLLVSLGYCCLLGTLSALGTSSEESPPTLLVFYSCSHKISQNPPLSGPTRRRYLPRMASILR